MAGTSPRRSRCGRALRKTTRFGPLTAAGITATALAVSAAALTVAAAAPAVVPARAVAGDGGDNGIERQSAQKIADRTEKALLGARSLRVRLIDNTARTSKHRPSAADLTLDRQGNCTGRLTLGQGGDVALIKRGDEIWLRPDEEFWKKQVPKVGGFLARAVGDRYVHGSVDDRFLKRLARTCDLDGFRREIRAASGASALTKGRPTTISRTRTVPLTGRQGTRSSTLYVSAEGTPYPLKAVVKGKQVDVTTTLSGFNQPVPSKTPSASDSVDISKLEDMLPG